MLKYFEESNLIKLSRENGRGNKLFVECLKMILLTIASVLAVAFMTIPTLILFAINNDDTVKLTLMSLFTNAFYILAVWFIIAKIQKRKMESIGFIKKRAYNEYIRGIIIGFIMITTVFVFSWLCGALKFVSFNSSLNVLTLLVALVGFFIQGMAEEVLCRGLILTSIARKNSVLAGIIVNSVIFSLMHISNDGFNIIATLNIAAFGVFMSLYMLRSGNIWGASAIHTIWNFMLGCVLGLPVSGVTLPSVFTFEKTSLHILNGGEFGPEGGLIVTALLGVAIALFIVKFKPPVQDVEIENTNKKSINKDVEKMREELAHIEIIDGEEREVVERCLNTKASSKQSKRNAEKKQKKK